MVAQSRAHAAQDSRPLPSPTTAETAHALVRMARPEPPGRRHQRGETPLPGLSGVQKAVARAVVDAGGFGVGWCFKSTAKLAVETAFSPRAVEDALAALVAKGWLHSQVLRLPSVNVMVRHYRITPVAADIMPDDEVKAITDAAADATRARVAASRAKRAAGDVRSHVTHRPCNVPQGPRAVTARAVVHSAGAAAEYLGDPEGVAPSCDAVSAAPEPPTHNVIAGMRVPARLRVAHAGYEAAALVMLADRLPALADAGCAYPVSLLGAEYGLGLLEIADAIASTANSLGCEATPEALAASLIGYGVLRPGRRAAVKRWLRKLGLPWSEGAAPMTALPIAAE